MYLIVIEAQVPKEDPGRIEGPLVVFRPQEMHPSKAEVTGVFISSSRTINEC